jgi:hypothetical protein
MIIECKVSCPICDDYQVMAGLKDELDMDLLIVKCIDKFKARTGCEHELGVENSK